MADATLIRIRRDGVTKYVTERNLTNFTRHGWQVAGDEPQEEALETEQENPAVLGLLETNPNGPSIQKIYELCDEAGVNPADITLPNETPTLAEVKAAIKAVKGKA